MTDRSETLNNAAYDVHCLAEAISAIERRLLEDGGREALEREAVELAELDARLHDIAFLLRPRLVA